MVAGGGDQEQLDRVLEALANPHRRDIVYVLGLHPWTISGLADMRKLSLPAIHKHIKVLEGAGLIDRHKRGRSTYLTLRGRALRAVQEWVGQFHPHWSSDQATYENFEAYLGINRAQSFEGSASTKEK